jgi:hypothetical protein
VKEKKLFLLICAICVLSVLAGPRILADSASKKELFFGPIVSGLEGTGLIASKSQGEMSPLIKASLTGGNTETIHFSLDMSQTSLNTVRGKDYVKIEGLKPHGNPGEPQLPFKSFIVTLPLNSEILGISVSDVAYRPIFNKLNIVSAPMPVARRTRNQKQIEEIQEGSVKMQEQNSSKLQGNYSECKTCNSQSFFPGNLVSYMTSKDNKELFIFIKFFPMQYILGTKRAVLITNADITVNYQLADSKQKTE